MHSNTQDSFKLLTDPPPPPSLCLHPPPPAPLPPPVLFCVYLYLFIPTQVPGSDTPVLHTPLILLCLTSCVCHFGRKGKRIRKCWRRGGGGTSLLFPSFLHHFLTTSFPLQIFVFVLFPYFSLINIMFHLFALLCKSPQCGINIGVLFYSFLFYSSSVICIPNSLPPHPTPLLTLRWSDCQILYSRLALCAADLRTPSPPLPPPRLSSITADTEKMYH